MRNSIRNLTNSPLLPALDQDWQIRGWSRVTMKQAQRWPGLKITVTPQQCMGRSYSVSWRRSNIWICFARHECLGSQLFGTVDNAGWRASFCFHENVCVKRNASELAWANPEQKASRDLSSHLVVPPIALDTPCWWSVMSTSLGTPSTLI